MNEKKPQKRKSRWSDSDSKDSDNNELIKNDKESSINEFLKQSGLSYLKQESDDIKNEIKIQKTSVMSNKSAEDDFVDQIKKATEKAKKIAEQINSNSTSCYSKTVNINPMSEKQTKELEEQKQLQELYDIMMNKRKEIDKIASKMRFKYEYDSDEECDENGTWEHNLRKAEIEATKEYAIKLTELAEEKHHIGDFLPPEEFKKFMQNYQALKNGKTLNRSDYNEFKLNTENIGFKLLQKLGWQQGQGLGKLNQGIVDPVNKSKTSFDKSGLGVEKIVDLNKDDDDFSMYRKRMMLSYKFRPNPMNNPRRPYY